MNVKVSTVGGILAVLCAFYWLSGIGIMFLGIQMMPLSSDWTPWEELITAQERLSQRYLGTLVGEWTELVEHAYNLAVLLLCIGVVTFFVALVGGFSVVHEKIILLLVFVGTLAVTLVLTLSAGIFASSLSSYLDKVRLQRALYDDFIRIEDPATRDKTQLWHVVQNEMTCCGVYDFRDIRKTTWYKNLPSEKAETTCAWKSCCVLAQRFQYSTDSNLRYVDEMGCKQAACEAQFLSQLNTSLVNSRGCFKQIFESFSSCGIFKSIYSAPQYCYAIFFLQLITLVVAVLVLLLYQKALKMIRIEEQFGFTFSDTSNLVSQSDYHSARSNASDLRQRTGSPNSTGSSPHFSRSSSKVAGPVGSPAKFSSAARYLNTDVTLPYVQNPSFNSMETSSTFFHDVRL